MTSEAVVIDQSESILPDTTKFIFLAAVFVTSFISSLLPLQIVSRLRNALDPERRLFYQRIVGVLNCFTGGVFMGTALLDLFPQVSSIMMKTFPDSKFPFAEFTIAFGLLLILSTEQIVIDCKEKTSDGRNPIERLQSRNVNLERETLTSRNQEELTPSPDSPLPENADSLNAQSTFNSVLLLMALSLHSLFEGLTIGLLKSPDIVIQLFVAILIHKIPVAFSLGSNLVQSELKTSAVIHLALWFSLMTPIGTGIGVILNTLPPIFDTQLLNGILIGLSTGTFIFIVFVEIFPKELKRGRTRLLNLVFLIIGFSLVCVAVLVETSISK